MNAILNKTNMGKYLAAMLALFVAVAGVAVIMSDDTADAATAPAGATQVSTADALVAAIAGDATDISLTADISVDSVITINRAVSIYGNNHTISASSAFSWNGNGSGTKNLISINGGTVSIYDTTFQSNDVAYGINIYGSSTVTLNTVSTQNSVGAGITINQATVTASSITASGNGWGSINVDGDGKLIINGTNTLSDGYQIWSESTGADDTEAIKGDWIGNDASNKYSWGKDNTAGGMIFFKNGEITNSLTIPSSDTILVPNGKELVNKSDVTNNGNFQNKGTFTNYGDFNNYNVMNNSGTFNNKTGAAVYNYNTFLNTNTVQNYGHVYGEVSGTQPTPNAAEDLGSLGLKDTINTNTTVDGEAFLSGNLTIPEGLSLTIQSNSTLDLMNYNITVYGTLIVERNATVTSSGDADNSIALMSSGIIQNDGTIGDSKVVRISNGANAASSAAQYVDMMGVKGVSFTLTRTSVSGSAVYNLNVSGDVTRISGVDSPTLILNNVIVNADMTIGGRISFTATDVSVARNVTLTNNGNAMVDIELENGARFIVAGATSGTIGAKAGVVGNNNAIMDGIGEDADEIADVNTSISLDGKATGITVSVGRVTVPNGSSSYVDQRLYVTGTIDLVAGTNANPITASDISFDGEIYVVDTLFVPKEVSVTGAFDVSESGTIQVEDRSADLDITYNGAKYVVETTVDSVSAETTYYTSFANAMGAIGTAQNGEIFVSGYFKVDESYTIGADQYISLEDGQNYVITVGENSVITVSEDGSIDNNAIGLIKGQVVVNDGGVYRPSNTASKQIYEVRSSNTETGTTIYSGFKVALDNAEAGDEIDVISSTATYKGNMTIISGVVVNLADGCNLTVTGNVTVQDQGELNLGNGSGLTVGTDGKTSTVTVAGTIDAENGTIAATSDATVNIYSTGSVIVGTAIADTGDLKVNSAYYTDVVVVYTSVAKAAAYATENALQSINARGTFSESGDIVLDGIVLYIDNGADVTLANVSLDGGSISMADEATTGNYSATVSALSGSGDAATQSTVQLVDTSATVASTSVLDSTGAYEYALTIDAISGRVTVSAGTVELVNSADDGSSVEISINNANSLTVDAGATFLIGTDSTIELGTSNPSTIKSNDYLVNNGTIDIEAQLTVNDDMTIPGDIIIDEGGELIVGRNASASDAAYTLTVTGTVTVSAVENHAGTLRVNGALNVGAAPKMLGDAATGSVVGEVILGNKAYVTVFEGASIADATLTDDVGTELKTTAFIVNGVDLASMYAFSTLSISPINTAVGGLENLTDDVVPNRNNFQWYSGETPIAAANIGDYETLSTEIEYESVSFKISAGPGLIIFIDEVRAGTEGSFTIGTHTITVYVDAGYEGTPSVTVNGQAITGGTFEVTTDMINGDNVIYATGATPADSTVVIEGGNGGSDGMGLTDYLLIILVILIVVMAIIVAMRLMRS